MKNRWLCHALVAVCVSGVVSAVAAEPPSELLRDRQRAAEAIKDKNPQRALKLIEPWVKKRPDDIELANDYALALAQVGRLDQAREVLEDALSKNRETGVAFQNLREILSQQAAISYAKAMGRKPPTSQVALKGAAPGVKEPPVVVAQVEPRPGATVEPPVAPRVSAAANAKGEPKSEPKAARGSDEKGAKAEKADRTADAGTDDKALSAALRAWADAWSDKDFKRYVSAYSEKFQPQQFPSREAWAAHRKPRVTRPGTIVVKVSDIRVKALSADRAEVTFRQRYEAGATKLNSVKTTVWIKESDGWKILREEGR
ncbi:MAG: hypothetical protein RL676_441 [Pseudomonadota bacterium]